ncbi:hypothetical protein TREES_T100021467 [Tupaia chinensis]|uniref:Uncharacterized protein n=1 Tax=Tupaia chinensis TaxID=246437 RepID=L9KIL8_TUPCH|nr:hypothetical protein TREES_T100021467 [Tupaia chinensis]
MDSDSGLRMEPISRFLAPGRSLQPPGEGLRPCHLLMALSTGLLGGRALQFPIGPTEPRIKYVWHQLRHHRAGEKCSCVVGSTEGPSPPHVHGTPAPNPAAVSCQAARMQERKEKVTGWEGLVSCQAARMQERKEKVTGCEGSRRRAQSGDKTQNRRRAHGAEKTQTRRGAHSGDKTQTRRGAHGGDKTRRRAQSGNKTQTRRGAHGKSTRTSPRVLSLWENSLARQRDHVSQQQDAGTAAAVPISGQCQPAGLQRTPAGGRLDRPAPTERAETGIREQSPSDINPTHDNERCEQAATEPASVRYGKSLDGTSRREGRTFVPSSVLGHIHDTTATLAPGSAAHTPSARAHGLSSTTSSAARTGLPGARRLTGAALMVTAALLSILLALGGLRAPGAV